MSHGAPAFLYSLSVRWLKVGDRNLDRLAYADDVDLMEKSKDEAGRKVVEFRRAVARVGQTINEDRTKLMKVTRGEAFVEELVECGGLAPPSHSSSRGVEEE